MDGRAPGGVLVDPRTGAADNLGRQAEGQDLGRIGIPCLAAGLHWIATGSRAGLVYLLRASDGQSEKRLKASGPVESIALSPDETLIACGTVKGTVWLIRLETGETLAEIPAHQDIVTSVAFDPAGGMLATSSRDRSVALWKLDSSAPTELVRIASPSGRPVLLSSSTPTSASWGCSSRVSMPFACGISTACEPGYGNSGWIGRNEGFQRGFRSTR